MTDLRSVQISARIPAEDAAFLASLSLEGAVTPSDKLRAIITAARRQHEGDGDFAGSLHWLKDVLKPALARVALSEHEAGLSSELLSILSAQLPPLLAMLMAARPQSADELRQLEASLAQRSLQLLEAVMRLGVTRRAACYDLELLHKQLPSILELAGIIAASRPHNHKE